MKANELMIGDWVLFATRQTKINGIAAGGFSVNLEHEGWQHISAIEPISLTAEILEKNFPDPEIVCWYPDNNTYRIIIGDDIALNIKYIHKLQHALRLFGIEKEIEL